MNVEGLFMKKVIVFGTGQGAERVIDVLLSDRSKVIGFLDNKKCRQGTISRGCLIYAPNQISTLQFDYIFISTIHDDDIRKQLERHCINEHQIISYYADAYENREEWENFINVDKWRAKVSYELLQIRYDALEKRLLTQMNNIQYELYDQIKKQQCKLPLVASGDDCINQILEDGASLCRYGDGEFEIMRNNERANFQRSDAELSRRLREIIADKSPNVLIGIADNYGSLNDKYTTEAANAIREYLTPEIRAFHEKCLDFERTYYDAYVTRPYILYLDKSKAAQKFARLKQIWGGRDVVIVEGEYTRMGVGNDLFDNVSSLRRILAPSINAWDKYEKILYEAKRLNRKVLVLISLGPTATVLAYDLAKLGYQAIDIGHLDNEYEWFLRGVDRRVDIAKKYVNEVIGGDIVDAIDDVTYSNSIIAKCM